MGLKSILMADVIKSRGLDAKATAADLKLLVAATNRKFKKSILSPLTITLGDEFQSVLKKNDTGIEIIFSIEELIIEKRMKLKLRYVLVDGKIETSINHKIAHGMLGEGLTKARETINYLKKSDDRFFFFTSTNTNRLNQLFIIYQSFVDGWKQKDLKLVSDFLLLDDYKLVASENERSVSLMWKRRKSLKIKEYKVIKDLIRQEYGME